MSAYSSTKSSVTSQISSSSKEAVAPQVMRTSNTGSHGQIGFGSTSSTNEIFYKEFKQWVYVCIQAIVSRVKCQPWMAGELIDADPNIERRARYGVKAIGKSDEQVRKELALYNKMPDFIRTKMMEGQNFEQLVGHPSVDMLAKPNPVQHSSEYLDMLITNLMLTGEAYAFGGETKESELGFEMWAVPTKWITPVHRNGYFESYIFTPSTFAAQVPVPANEVLRIYFPDPSDITKSFSPMQAAIKSVMIDEKLQKSQYDQFGQGIFPNVAVKVAKLRNADGTQSNNRPILTSAQRRQVTRAIRQVWRNSTANGDPAILDGLIEDVFKLTHTPREMDWQATGNLIKDRIYHAFRVNPIITGERESANRASAVVAEKSFVKNVVNPLIDMISRAHTEHMGAWYEQPSRLTVFLEKVNPEDEELKLKRWTEARKNGDVTSSEYRSQVLGLAPLTPEERGEQSATLIGVTGGLQNTIALAEKVSSGTVPRESAIEISKLFLGVDDLIAGMMFPEPEEPVQPDPMIGLPPGVVPPAGFIESEEDQEDGKAKNAKPLTAIEKFRINLKNTISGHIDQGTSALQAVMAPFFQRQIESAADELRKLTGSKIVDLVQKNNSATARALQLAVFDSNKWIQEMVQVSSPVMARIFKHGVDTELSFIDKAKDEKTTASQVVELLGAMDLDGVSFEWPAWMQTAARTFLNEQFAQEYWARIPETTAGHIRSYIESGLNEGWSIRRVANEMASAFPSEYYTARAMTVARTESTDALNAGHNSAIIRTGQDTGIATEKEWLSVMGDTTRRDHASADGQTVSADGNFNVGGYAAPWPGHHSLPPGQRCNCLCTSIAAFAMNDIKSKLMRAREK
jgi:phage portal protein BeeE